MAKNSRKFTALLIGCMTALLSVIMVSADTPTMTPNTDFSQKGNINIIYKDDDPEGEDPVVGADFDIYKIADIGPSGEYISIIPEFGFEGSKHESLIIDEYTDPDVYIGFVKQYYENKMEDHYLCHTNQSGEAKVRELPIGLYLVEESTPAKEHLATKPFMVSIPHMNYEHNGNYGWEYDITCYPKSQPCGDLLIAKRTQGTGAEPTRDFHFTVTFGIQNMPFHYRTSDGREGTIKSGEAIVLKHMQSALIDTIPIGTSFKVSEVEANTEGYKTTATGTEGRIFKKTVGKAEFMNERELTQTPAGGNGTGSGKTGSVQTGDEFPLMAAGVALVLMAMIIGIATRTRKKKK